LKDYASYRAQLLAKERLQIAEARMPETAKWVGWLFLALTGFWLCLRVGQWTKTSGRLWLRFTLAGVVLAGGAALLFFS
jgi:hypothetical protein